MDWCVMASELWGLHAAVAVYVGTSGKEAFCGVRSCLLQAKV